MTGTLKRTAYAAMGAPTVARQKIVEALREAREVFHDLGDRMQTETRREVEDWIAEGERIVESLRSRMSFEAMQERLEGAAQETTRRTVEVAEEAGVAEPVRRVVETARAAATSTFDAVVAIEQIAGIGPANAEKLAAAGVATTNALLERASDPAGRTRLAEQTGISATLLETWTEEADLSRVKGVGDDYRTLLQRSGIGTLRQLAAADGAELHDTMERVNEEGHVVAQLPSARTVARWITEAGSLAG